MARVHTLYGRVTFTLSSFAEFESLQSSAKTFVGNRGGEIDVKYFNHDNETDIYTTSLEFLIPTSGWAQSETYKNSMDTALLSLPTHSGLCYKHIEREVPDA